MRTQRHDFEAFTIPAGAVYYPGRGVHPVTLTRDAQSFRCRTCGHISGDPKAEAGFYCPRRRRTFHPDAAAERWPKSPDINSA